MVTRSLIPSMGVDQEGGLGTPCRLGDLPGVRDLQPGNNAPAGSAPRKAQAPPWEDGVVPLPPHGSCITRRQAGSRIPKPQDVGRSQRGL